MWEVLEENVRDDTWVSDVTTGFMGMPFTEMVSLNRFIRENLKYYFSHYW